MTTPQSDNTPRPRCVSGTYLDKMNEAIRFSEEKRWRVVTLTQEISEASAQELIKRHRQLGKPPPTKAHLETAADKACEADPRWQTAVGDEQWGYRLTTMYALAELVAATRENTQVLKAIYEEARATRITQQRLLIAQQTTNDLLQKLVGHLTVPVDAPDRPVPPQRAGD